MSSSLVPLSPLPTVPAGTEILVDFIGAFESHQLDNSTGLLETGSPYLCWPLLFLFRSPPGVSRLLVRELMRAQLWVQLQYIYRLDRLRCRSSSSVTERAAQLSPLV